jgi:threonine synthase
MAIGAQSASTNASLAIAQRSLGDPSISYPLMPPLTSGCPRTSTEEIAYPVEVVFDYARVDRALFDQPPLPGLERWAPLLPPLAPGVAMQDGGTPLVDVPTVAAWAGFDGELYIKDESRNPTWSHKDRLNLCTVSAAVLSGAPGVIVASSGNHGAAAAAHAARAGLPCIVLTSLTAPTAVLRFLLAYGAAVVTPPPSGHLPAIRQIVDRLGYMPMGNLTVTHTGHPFGPEGYKTVAYETFLQLGRRVPAAVFVPTGYGELLSGAWKGFRELRDLGLADRAPAIVACEPAALGPLARAVREGRPAVAVGEAETEAYAIACTVNGYRSVLSVRDSGGAAMTVTDAELYEARRVMGRDGLWPELSSAAGVAAFRQAVAAGQRFDGPVVCISTSNGFKDLDGDRPAVPQLGDDWPAVQRALGHYGLRV